ncbi:hypothetical protein QVH35_09135 [Candidatus Nitrosotenuis chungbukensis]|uniref:hypothetical protein n=1 Tax=Candidatus Nitrosotenuis chungbukensis TaxID=1353246 RepID=UPI0005B26657|nr:hypothetical protein [Candidatus Nitrosotenuis chungbukensis]WKT57519.1 hypothetical protein QVH35_09135 [Candidatus Nitrosotenuis chungbukensis]
MSKTPEEKWKESIISYRKNCQNIIAISKSIRYAGVINEYGRTLTGIIQPGIKPILKPEDAKNEFFIVSNLITLRHVQSKAFGSLDHIVLQHKKATIVCVPDGNIVYYVSLNPGTTSLEGIIKKIKSVV